MPARSDGSESGWMPPADRQRWGEAEAQAMVEAFRDSGLSVREFAERHGIGEWRVRKWAGRLSVKSTAPRTAAASTGGRGVRFAPVRLVPATRGSASGSAPRSGSIVEVVVGGAVVRVTDGFDEDLLRRVVSALGGTGC